MCLGWVNVRYYNNLVFVFVRISSTKQDAAIEKRQPSEETTMQHTSSSSSSSSMPYTHTDVSQSVISEEGEEEDGIELKQAMPMYYTHTVFVLFQMFKTLQMFPKS